MDKPTMNNQTMNNQTMNNQTMNKPTPVFGNGNAYFANYETKNQIIDLLYSKLDLSKHRYNILNNVQKLEFLQKNIHYVSPNFKGFNYIVLFLNVNNMNLCVAIDRKKLSYHKSQLDMKTITILKINMNVDISLYKMTIFDGKLIQSNNKYTFLIQDCFYLSGVNMLDIDMKQKMVLLNTMVNDNFKKEMNYCKNFDFKLNKLYEYSELEELVTNLPKISIPNNGLIFYPIKSGITTLYIDKKVETVTINSANTNNEVIEQKSYHIINDFIDFLKSRSYSYETGSKISTMWLSRTEIPDVYDISTMEHGDKIGIAMIPNLKTSQMCDNTILDVPRQFNCVYSNKFKKWIPLNLI